MRVLHLIDLRDRGDESQLACAAALGVREARHRVIGLGSARDVAWTRSHIGLEVDAALAPVSPWPEASFRRLRALIGDRDGRDATRPWADLVQCWGPGVAGLARLASGHRTPPRAVALLAPPQEPLQGIAMKRASFGLSHAHCFAFCRDVRSAWATPIASGRGGRMLEQNIRLLDPPAWTGATATESSRAAARARLGLTSQDVVITLLADPPAAADIASFVFTLGLLFTTGVRVIGLARVGRDGASVSARRAARFVRLHGRRWGLRLVDESTDGLLTASDAAVWLGPEEASGRPVACGPLLIHRAIARGVPVVAARHPISLQAIEAYGDSVARGRVVRDGSLAAIADGLLQALSNASASPTLRKPVGQVLGPDRFGEDLLALWREATNTPVLIPGLPTPLAMLEGVA